MNTEFRQWFVVYSKPRRETEAVDQLDRQGYIVFLPCMQIRRRLRGQWQEVIEPMFPRYLFLQATLGEDDLVPVRSTRGVIGLVRFGGKLRPVTESIMVELIRLCGDRGILELPQRLKPGSRVRILEGPFAGYEAELLNYDGERRAVVLLNLLGSTHALQMPVDNLEVVVG